MQLSLLGNEPGIAVEPEQSRGTFGTVLRDYQAAIAEQALSYLSQGRNPLCILATGTGKTRLAAHVVRHFPGRVLWVAHRIELVRQGIEALEDQLGERVDSETANSYSAYRRVVVASKDTVRTTKRLARLGSYDSFDLVVIDEAHHSAAGSYWSIIDAYPQARRLGLTATPGRLDKKQLRAFDCLTRPLGIVEASEAGWLVPIRAKRERVKTVDLSGIGTVAGDFNQGELNLLMKSEATLHAIAKAILDRLGHGPCLHFATGVDVAERQCEVLNRYRPGMARFVSGKTPEQERRRLFAEFGRTYQALVNVGVATEGTDLPGTAIVSMGRPTKSPALFQQMLGRGLRPLSGIVDGIGSARERLAAIKASKKSHCLVLDFVGTTGRHTVQTVADAYQSLGEDGTTEAAGAVQTRIADRIAAGEEIELAGVLAQEIADEKQRQAESKQKRDAAARRRMALVAKVELTSTDVRLIGLGGEIAESDAARTILDGPPTPGQVSELSRLGCTTDGLGTARAAKARIEAARKEQDYASPKMLELIRRYRPELYRPDMKRKKAGYIISQITRHWR